MDLFPVFFGTKDVSVIVVGGGENARRKVRLLTKTHARIHVCADQLAPAFADEFQGRIETAPFEHLSELLNDAKFVIVALEEDDRLEAVLADVRAARLPVNVVDRPELCDFTVPSILDRGSVVGAIATGGAAPVLARKIRAQLEALMPKRLGDLADFARSFRGAVKSRFADEADRKSFWEKVFSGPIADKVLAGKTDDARTDMLRELEETSNKQGVVHIVGAGPGDPELLTLKALRVLQDADIVFYDKLVGDGVMDLVRRDAERISVGKSKGNHSVPQPQIHEYLIEAARAGKRVVRLKGGDPFIFGRGGEELLALREAGIDAYVVPGISSALGCAASTGVPLTHRNLAQSVTFVTGHAKNGEAPDLDWPSLARANQTVVVYMGVGTAPDIQKHLIEAGRSALTPVLVVENGTRDNEVRATGRLEHLSELIETRGIRGPALLIIGEVASLSEDAIAEAQTLLEHAA